MRSRPSRAAGTFSRSNERLLESAVSTASLVRDRARSPPMSPDPDRDDPAQELAMQAAWDWVMKAHEQPLSDAEHEALARWLDADPRHRSAHAQASRLWLLSGL